MSDNPGQKTARQEAEAPASAQGYVSGLPSGAFHRITERDGQNGICPNRRCEAFFNIGQLLRGKLPAYFQSQEYIFVNGPPFQKVSF